MRPQSPKLPATGPNNRPTGSLNRNHSTSIQRFITIDKTVYYPDTVTFTANQSKANFERALKILGGPPAEKRAAQVVSWPKFAQDHLGANATLDWRGEPTGGTNQKKIKIEFLDPDAVYYYKEGNDLYKIGRKRTREKYPLLSFDDMAEANTSELPEKASHKDLKAQKCAIEVLEAFGKAVPKEKGKVTAETNVEAWHQYSRNKRLDYRQDNNYIVFYVQDLGFPLINNTWIKWDEWEPGQGKYIATSTNIKDPGPGAVGHVIGVTVNGQGKTITDKQGLSPGTGTTPAEFENFKLRYIFRVE